jgi:N-ethylmaleimide reductase
LQQANDTCRGSAAVAASGKIIRKRFSGVYIANSQYTLQFAEDTLAVVKADMFSFGRPFLANPDFVNRLRTGAPLAEAPNEYW